MAVQEGATVQEILSHYYTGIELGQAAIVPRTTFRRSVIFGQVVDGQGRGRGGLRLTLSGPGGSLHRGTTGDGRFWFTKLPAGQWDLRVKGQPVRYQGLFTDGRNTLELSVVVPDKVPLTMVAEPLGSRGLAGTLGYPGVPVTVGDGAGNEQTVLSGSAPDYAPGGFFVSVPSSGTYTVRVLDQSFEVEIGEGGLRLRFEGGPG
jgi:hypothetical protein